ncbi:MAG: hypothetical protein KDC88_02060, partial [Ignavibacteriae bacterium]|nr:hypothetical protein [Ignavibacteriota bacterium]
PWFVGIASSQINLTAPIKITNNEIHEMNIGTKIEQPYNITIAYNKMYDFWRDEAYANMGGYAIGLSGYKDGDTWDANYTVHIHHNEIFNFEYVALGVGNSRLLIEYNNIHSNLDERIYRGGVKHGSIGKIYDNTGVKLGGIGTIFRYNYVHDLVRRGEPNFTYGKQSSSKVYSKTYDVESTNNGTGRSIYKYSVFENGSGFGDHFGDVPGESPDAIISGLGYSNIWIHNNIFENCSNRLFTRTFIDGSNYGSNTYRSDLPTYLINNTIINCGWLDYITGENGFMNTEWDMSSDHFQINNIIDFTNTKARYALYLKGNSSTNTGKIFYDFNIYTKQKGVVNNAPNMSANIAVFDRDGKGNQLSGSNEQYLKSPNWNNVSNKIWASNIGANGTYIPDVRIIEGGNAYNKGMPFDQIGDNFTVKGQKHQKGKDPTGRNFAYDILGHLRNTNDIGALGPVAGTIPNNFQTLSNPIITVQPLNVNVNIGNDVSFSVTANCDDPIGYQWWKFPFISNIESKILDNEKYSGATTNKLTIKNIQNSDAEIKYICEIYNTEDHTNLWVNSNQVSIIINPDQESSFNENLKVFLEAPFLNGKMNNSLFLSQNLPNNQPYYPTPWELISSESVKNLKSYYIDWIVVELRKEFGEAAYRKPAILTSDGIVLNADGTSLSFNNIESGDFYIAIIHRNHLGIISSKTLNINKDKPVIYDFTNSVSKAYGSNALADLGNGIFGMYAGDADANGVINNLDFGVVANHILQKGYLNNDLDMNGVINVLDYNKINKNILKKSFVKK